MRINIRPEGKRKKVYCNKTVHFFTIVTIIFTVITVNYNNCLQFINIFLWENSSDLFHPCLLQPGHLGVYTAECST